MANTKPCDQTSLATDNDAIPCDGNFTSTACAVHPDALVELNLPENSTNQDIINAFLQALINLNTQSEQVNDVISGNMSGSNLVLTKLDSTTVVVDMSTLLDNTNLSRVTTGAIVGTDLVLTRDDSTDITIDVSGLTGTNLSRIVSGEVVGTDLILTRDDATTITTDLSALSFEQNNKVRIIDLGTIDASSGATNPDTLVLNAINSLDPVLVVGEDENIIFTVLLDFDGGAGGGVTNPS